MNSGNMGGAQTPEQLERMQEQLDRILEVLIHKLDLPFVACEDHIARLNTKLGISALLYAPHNARTGKAQEIYNTVHRAERIVRSIEHIEQVLYRNIHPSDEPIPSSGTMQATLVTNPASKLSYSQLKISEDQGAYKETKGLDYERHMKEVESEHGARGYQSHDLKHGQFTHHGLHSVNPMSNAKKNVKDPLDTPFTERATVKPWSTKYPITLTATLGRKKWFQGENMRIDTEIQNESPKSIRSLECTLVRRSQSYVYKENEKMSHNKKDKAVLFKDFIPSGYPIGPRLKKEATVHFKLPFKLKPSSSGGPDGTFEIQYYLYIRAIVPGHTGPTVEMGPLRVCEFVV